MKKIILLLAVFFLSGCYDYVELDEMKLVSSVIVDYEDGDYTVNLEVLNSSKDAEQGSQFITSKGKNFEDALNNVRNSIDADPYYGHMSSLIISKSFAENGIEEIFDFLARNIEIRKDFYIFLSDNVDSLLEYESNKGESFGINLKKTYLRSLERNGKFKTCNLREMFRKHLRNEPYILGSVDLDDNTISLVKDYVFKDNKLALEIEEDVALLSNIIEGNNWSFLVSGNDSFEIYGYKMDSKVEKDKIVLKIEGSGRIKSVKDGANTMKNIDEMEKKVSAKISKRFIDIIEYSKKTDIDILGFNYMYYLHYPKLVCDDTWKKLNYEVKVEVVVGDKGMTTGTLKGDKNGK